MSGASRVAVGLIVAACAAPACAIDFTWSKLYDSATVLPGTNQTPFFLSAPAISNGNIAFAAGYTAQFTDYEGIYALVNGNLQRVLDLTTVLPGSNNHLVSYTIFPPAIHGGEVALYAVGYNDTLGYPWNAGIYRWNNGVLSLVADEQMNVPAAPSKFYDFNGPDIRNGKIIFNGVDEDGVAAGVYTQSVAGGPLTTIADTGTQVPGHPAGTNFFGFPYRLQHTTLLPDGSALFMGGYQAPPENTNGSGLFGIYRTLGPGGAIVPVVEDEITPIPNGGGTFVDIYTATVADDDGTIVFFGRDFDTRGIYAVLPDGTMQAIVDSTTLVPDGSKTFGSFGLLLDEVNFAYNNGVLLFEGYDRITDNNNVLHGLYLATLDGEIHQLLTPGQVFDGKTIQYWMIARDSLHSNGIGLTVHFTDGSSGIYTTSTAALAIPEPAAISLAAFGVVLAARRRRSH